jgi:hypothetical protein
LALCAIEVKKMSNENQEIEMKKSRQKRDAVRGKAFKTVMHIMCNPNASPGVRAEASALGREIAIATLLDETLDHL